MTQPTSSLSLPWCNYPSVSDTQLHGLSRLSKDLPKVNFESALKHRSNQYVPIPLEKFDTLQVLELACIIALSFAKNEPMNRHVHPPKRKPKELSNVFHEDPFGKAHFGNWSTDNLLYWFVRLVLLTNPSDAIGSIRKNADIFLHSLAFANDKGNPIGGALNSTLPAIDEEWREQDLFIKAIFLYQDPIIHFIHEHEHEYRAIDALDNTYPHFKKAHQSGKVGYISMIARSTELPSEHTFELFASSFESFQKQGYEYMLITGTNQWTGAASEVLGAARIYFTPFRDKKRVAKEIDANRNEPFSTDGYISAKDSGLMVYAVKL